MNERIIILDLVIASVDKFGFLCGPAVFFPLATRPGSNHGFVLTMVCSIGFKHSLLQNQTKGCFGFALAWFVKPGFTPSVVGLLLAVEHVNSSSHFQDILLAYCVNPNMVYCT